MNQLSIKRGWARALLAALIGCLASVAQAQPEQVNVVDVGGGFTSAIGVTSAGDNSGRMFVIEQGGAIRIWDNGTTLATPFLNLSGQILSGGEQGLLGLAFHPNYASNGLFFVNYTDLAGDTVVARFSVSAANPNIADPASELLIMTFSQPAGNHNGGDMHFGPDDMLYIASGDGGFPGQNSQDLSNLLGKLLRIDIDADDFPSDPNRNYAIPPDNPFVGSPGAMEEIWILGLRNPWRFSFDRLTGDLFVGDVGEGDWEEVNFIPASSSGQENFGWPCYEGPDPFDTNGCAGMSAYDFPILLLPHDPFPDNNCSVIGGYRYRGSDFPSLGAWYFYKDWCTGMLWAAQFNGQDWDAFEVLQLSGFSHTGFGESDDGELYLVGNENLLQVTGSSELIFEDSLED